MDPNEIDEIKNAFFSLATGNVVFVVNVLAEIFKKFNFFLSVFQEV